MTQVNFHESQQCWAFNPRVVSQASRTTMPSRSRRSGRGPEALSLAAGSTTIQDGERTLGASPCFHTKADVAQWIGANGRKWRAKLRSLPYVVLDNVITILGVPQSRHKGKRMHKEQLGELVCKTAAWMQKRGPPQSSERVPSKRPPHFQDARQHVSTASGRAHVIATPKPAKMARKIATPKPPKIATPMPRSEDGSEAVLSRSESVFV